MSKITAKDLIGPEHKFLSEVEDVESKTPTHTHYASGYRQKRKDVEEKLNKFLNEDWEDRPGRRRVNLINKLIRSLGEILRYRDGLKKYIKTEDRQDVRDASLTRPLGTRFDYDSDEYEQRLEFLRSEKKKYRWKAEKRLRDQGLIEDDWYTDYDGYSDNDKSPHYFEGIN